MDSLAHWRRLGLVFGSDIPDELLVTHAGPADPDSATLILQLCYQRVSEAEPTAARDHLLSFLETFAFWQGPASQLDNEILSTDVSNLIKFVEELRPNLGDSFSDYLSARFAQLANKNSATPISAAFFLRLEHRAGRSTEIERNYEIAESVDAILADLKGDRLRKCVQRFLNHQSSKLFASIERHLRIVGHLSFDVSSVRLKLANKICEITASNGKNGLTAAEIYTECIKARQELLRKILADDRSKQIPDTERTALKDQIQCLNSYGAALPGKGANGVGVTGIYSVYNRYKKKLPAPFRGSYAHYSGSEVDELISNHTES